MKFVVSADRGYYSGEEILACDKAGIAITLPKPMTSGIEAKGRFGKQDFVYLSDEDAYRCPAGEKLKYYYTNEENVPADGPISNKPPCLIAGDAMGTY
jgi:hypothetical protein